MSAASSDSVHVSDDGQIEYVTLTIADQLFGVPVSLIHDVFTPQTITPVPLAPPEVAGVLNLRGRIVTAIDARVKLGLPPLEERSGCMAVGVERNGESYGIIIDGVGEVLKLGIDEYEPNPVNLDPRWQSVSQGVYRLKGDLLVALDIDQLLDWVSAAA
ncbi:MAG: chemotaxis protein CheW [Pseudomonadota bacterium]